MINLIFFAAYATTLVTAVPAPNPTLVERASCTFTDAAAAIASKKACSTITLNSVVVPAGTTLDLTGLADGTKVSYHLIRTRTLLMPPGRLLRHDHIRI